MVENSNRDSNKSITSKKITVYLHNVLTFRSDIQPRQFLLLFISLVVIASSLLVAFSPVTKNSSAKEASSMTLSERTLSYVTLNALRMCIQNNAPRQVNTEVTWLGTVTTPYINQANAESGNWWNGEAKVPGSYLNSGTDASDRGGPGVTLCNDILKTGLTLWGYANGLDLLCDAGIKRDDGGPCDGGTAKFGSLRNSADAINSAVTKKIYNNETPSLYMGSNYGSGYPGRYLIYQAAFLNGCQAKKTTDFVSSRSEFYYTQTDVSEDGTPVSQNYVGGISNTTNRPVYVDRAVATVTKTCKQIADEMNSYAMDYGLYRKDGKQTEPITPVPVSNDGSGSTPVDGSTSCAVPGIGWIICPVVTFLAGVADSVYGIIEQFLELSPKILSTESGAYSAWSVMRSFANVFLVIAFIFIIYSQLTGLGISNYGVKKTLPRLIIVAILINISFLLCQLAVDISNILGGSLKSFLANLPVFQSAEGNWFEKTVATGNFFTNMAVGVMAGNIAGGALAGAAAIGYFFGLSIFIPVVVAVIVAVLMTFFILLARQMLVIILIITAPLAFAALLLPNTQRWAKWWQKAFVAILLIYPAIALLFGGAQLASNILIQVQPEDFSWQLAAAAVAIMPLFLVPSMLKGSLNAIPAIGNMAQKLQARAVGSAVKGSAKGMKTLGEYSAFKSGTSKGFGRLSKTLQGRGMRGRLKEASARRSYEEPRMKDLLTRWNESEDGQSSIAQDGDALAKFATDNPTSLEGQAAISLLANQGDAVRLSKVREKIREKGDPASMAAYSRSVASNFGALKAKHPGAVQDMIKKNNDGSVSVGWEGIKQSDMHGMKDGALMEGMEQSKIHGSTVFETTLRTAMQDPEQARNFTDEMYKKLEITRPTATTPSVSTKTVVPAPQAAPTPPTPHLDPYDQVTARRQQEIQTNVTNAGEMPAEFKIFHEEQARRDTGAAPQTSGPPSTPSAPGTPTPPSNTTGNGT